MGKKYDTESFIQDVYTILQAQINAKIVAVEADCVAAGKPVTNLAQVDLVNAFYEQSLSDNTLSMSPAVFFGLDDTVTKGIGPQSSKDIKVFVELIHIDGGNDKLGKRRVHRYTRVLEEIFEENYDKFGNANLTKVSALLPLSFKLEGNTSEQVRVAGVSITTSLA